VNPPSSGSADGDKLEVDDKAPFFFFCSKKEYNQIEDQNNKSKNWNQSSNLKHLIG
jgi:hypothetical protein